MKHPTCKTCVYAGIKGTDSGGACRINPPTVHPVNGLGKWPWVDSTDWCSKHRAAVHPGQDVYASSLEEFIRASAKSSNEAWAKVQPHLPDRYKGWSWGDIIVDLLRKNP
jgi:hypothetical protein